MARLKRIPVAVAAIVALGCGGGGGSDTCNDSVACIQPDPASLVDSAALIGSYDIQYSLASNSCPGAAPLSSLREQYSASSGVGYHGAPTIEVSSSNGIPYLAYSTIDNTDGKTFFRAVEDFGGQHELPNFLPGLKCTETISLSLFNIEKPELSATRTSDILCLGASDESSVSCQVVYTGAGSFTKG